MLKEIIPNIRKLATEASTLFLRIDDASEQQERDQEYIDRLAGEWQALLGTQGARVLRATREWASLNPDVSLPGSFIAELDTAIELLTERKVWEAAQQIRRASMVLVLDADYDTSSLQDVALIACLVSALAELQNGSTAYRQRLGRSIDALAEQAVEIVAKQAGELDHLVSQIAKIFYYHGEALGTPTQVSVCDLRSLLINNIESEDLAGVTLALWAATHGHLPALDHAIQLGVASLARNPASKREKPSIEVTVNKKQYVALAKEAKRRKLSLEEVAGIVLKLGLQEAHGNENEQHAAISAPIRHAPDRHGKLRADAGRCVGSVTVKTGEG